MNGIYRSVEGREAVRRRYREILAASPVACEQRSIATRHGDTFVVSTGPRDAPPVVVLHGAGTNSSIWLPDAARWSQKRRVHLVDVLGEPGLSAENRLPLESTSHAEWLDDVADGMEAERPAFVGASLGGWLALDYAIRRPARVERLALLAPGGVGRQRYGILVEALALMLLGERGTRIALRRVLGETTDSAEFLDFMVLLQENTRPRRERLPTFTDEQLAALVAPVLVVVGGRDRMLDSRGTARRIRAALPNAVVVEHPEAGHALIGDGMRIGAFLTNGFTAADVKAAMRRDLVAAMKEHRSETVSALRSAIAALDNAEAVDARSVHPGVTEVARRDLSADDVLSVLRGQRDAHLVEARRCEELGRWDAAQRLRSEAEVVRAYL